MIKIGLTGGIGSGKSIFAELLHISGIPVYIADKESKKLTETSIVIRTGLTELFGKEVYKNGILNKPFLANLIFNNPEALKAVNNIIHPEVLNDFKNWAKKLNSRLCVMESAILFESGFDKYVDYKVLIYAPEKVRIQRVKERDGMQEEDVQKRINNQMQEEEKKALADFIINNDHNHALIPYIFQPPFFPRLESSRT